MSDLEDATHEPEENPFPATDPGAPGLASETWDSTAPSVPPAYLFQSFSQPEAVAPQRIPHLGHLALLAAFLLFGFVCATVLGMVALYFHLDGVSTQEQISTNVYYLLGFEAVLYLVTLSLAIPIFPLFWKKSFFTGVHWRGATALRLSWRLPGLAVGCFVLALIDDKLLPGPEHAPIEDLFRTPRAAWMMFFFGITIAPLLEEIVFRGFLLPAFSTAFDWIAENFFDNAVLHFDSDDRPKWSIRAIITASILTCVPFALCIPKGHDLTRFLILVVWSLSAAITWAFVTYRSKAKRNRISILGPDGHPQWSIAAMVIASIATSLPFALMHGEQTGHSFGPLLLLIVVSLILCAVRLKTRSLAASTLLHACYNFLIFSSMMVGTGGFQHLDKL
jgi:membrane protease YdiL (CAAX protease family)